MIVAVNTRILTNDFPEEYGNFIFETYKRIAANNPEQTFIFFVDKKITQQVIFGANVKTVVTGPAAQHPLRWKFWYDFKLPALLKKYNADVFVSCNGICSLRTKVPQCLLIHDLAFLQPLFFMKKSQVIFFKRYTPAFLAIAKSITTVSGFFKQEIISHYKIDSAKIEVVFSGTSDNFQPISNEEKAIIKSKYTDGREYFVYSGEIHPRKNVINLLKAFSVFKKRQQTNMKLLLAGKLAKKYGSFQRDLQSYKYRNDVVMIAPVDESERINIIGAAYGLIDPSLYAGAVVPLLEAMKCDVAVITAADSSMHDIVKEAVLHAEATTYTGIADKMMLLYKDENIRKELIEKGKEIARQYDWEKTAALVWQSILKACK